MAEGHDRPQPSGATRFEHPRIMVELSIGEVTLAWLDPRPFDAEPIAIESEIGGDRDILGVTVIAVASVARPFLEDGGLEVLHQPGVAVDIVALTLMRRDRSAPQEVRR